VSNSKKVYFIHHYLLTKWYQSQIQSIKRYLPWRRKRKRKRRKRRKKKKKKREMSKKIWFSRSRDIYHDEEKEEEKRRKRRKKKKKKIEMSKKIW
jgi:hypothetical protein